MENINGESVVHECSVEEEEKELKRTTPSHSLGLLGSGLESEPNNWENGDRSMVMIPCRED